jgi:hypothetical protein
MKMGHKYTQKENIFAVVWLLGMLVVC